MWKIRTQVLCIALAALFVTMFSKESLAYYSVVGTATNVITSGDIRLQIHETTGDGSEFPEEGVYIVPGSVVSKRVSVENVCEHPFWLRVQVVDGVSNEALSSTDCFELNIDTEHWIENGGYYYYYTVLQPHEITEHLFTEVHVVGSKVTNDYLGSTLTLTVDAFAVQSENNPADAPWEADGWPERGDA